ncbi:hypothetical protein, partial [Nosocomiicoccus sp. HMSC059G07]|uniref:hypothetical protein n=1 Tax=Nosocomiicoccus sp. HMSC059G07 TaxID=1739531 RepID=UPI00143B0244
IDYEVGETVYVTVVAEDETSLKSAYVLFENEYNHQIYRSSNEVSEVESLGDNLFKRTIKLNLNEQLPTSTFNLRYVTLRDELQDRTISTYRETENLPQININV